MAENSDHSGANTTRAVLLVGADVYRNSVDRLGGTMTADELSALCDAEWILEMREKGIIGDIVGPVGEQILASARRHLEQSLRDYLTKGKG